MPVTINKDLDALVVVDVQNDFVASTGALYVPGAEQIVPVINRISSHYVFRTQVATQDWHPRGHCSFIKQGGQWPPHCVWSSKGAELHGELQTDRYSAVLRKGMRVEADSYSGFKDEGGRETGLAGLLTNMGVRRLIVVGVAEDYCVFFTALDAAEAGFQVVVITDAVAAVDSSVAARRREELSAKGVQFSLSVDLE